MDVECLVCKPGTYISVSHEGNAELQSHLNSDKRFQGVRGASASTKVTNCFAKTGNEVTAAEGTYAFHTVKHHNSFFIMDCTSSLQIKNLP